MTLTIPDEILRSAHLDESALNSELAIALFQQDRLTLGQGAQLAGIPQLDFQRLLAGRKIPIHYDLDQLESDLNRIGMLSAS